MYANHVPLPRGSRVTSFGAALAINAALMLGLIYAGPKVLSSDPIPTLPIRSIPLPPVPPPTVPPEPRPQQQPRVARPYAPPTPHLIASESPVATTSDPQPYVPPISFPDGAATAGSGIAEPTPTPLPTLIGATADPRYAGALQPDYPTAERRAGNEGSVVVRVLIGTDGRVRDVEKVRATSDAFYAVTRRQALTRWRFRPATRGSVPQESWLTMTVRFELDR